MFLLLVILLIAVGGFCWVRADRALADRDVAAATGYWVLYGALAVPLLLAVT